MTPAMLAPPASPSAAPTRRRFTAAGYYAMGEAGILTEDDRVELLDGELGRVVILPFCAKWTLLAAQYGA